MPKQKAPKGKKPQDTDEDQDPKEQEGSEDTEDDEDNEDDAAEENRRLNAIVTSRVKREMKAVNQTLQAMQETLKSLATPKADTEDDDEDSAESKKETQADPKITKKISRMEKELAEEKLARKKAEEERTQELERGKKAEMRGAFQSVLSEYGLSPRLMRAALDQLEQDGIMVRDDDGKPKFKGQDKYGIETLFDPKAGLKAWVSSEGKEFVPAVDAGGSGTGGSIRGTGNGTQALTAKDLKKMTPQQLASINLERACSGLPALGEDQ